MKTASDLALALSTIRSAPRTEIELQNQISACLDRAGIFHEREVLTPSGPVDFVIDGTTAVEVKTSGSAISVARQIIRYLEDDRFDSCILITIRPMILPVVLVPSPNGDKPIHVLDLWKNFI